MTNEVVYYPSSSKDDVWILLLNFNYETKYKSSYTVSIKEGARIENTLFKAKWQVLPVKLAALLKRNFPLEIFLASS